MILCRFTNNILSTVQQVWLQKLGGAKNPVIQEDQLWIQKTVSEINSTKMKTGEVEKLTPEDSTKPKAGQIENLTPEGLRPGERFFSFAIFAIFSTNHGCLWSNLSFHQI